MLDPTWERLLDRVVEQQEPDPDRRVQLLARLRSRRKLTLAARLHREGADPTVVARLIVADIRSVW